jgi:hypothetical protein
MHDPMVSDPDDLGDYSDDDETSRHPDISATDIEPLDICVEELALSGKADTNQAQNSPCSYLLSRSSASRSLKAISLRNSTLLTTLYIESSTFLKNPKTLP